uniref:Putative serine protease inhibitor i/ii n=1 Tax=Panstrongylus lignarius TaxID=156445 RepID=A0A224XR41_9HEMI
MLTKFQLILLPVALVFAEVSSKRCIGHGCNTKKRSLDNELDSCKPGSNWREDCNKCTCNELGQTVCTQWPCDPNQPELIFKKISVGRRSCNEGDLWFKDCNICVCHGLGRSVCTEYNCHKYNWVHNKLRKRRETGIKAGSTCTPGTTWKVDCNTCFCSETGYIGCTLRGCLSPYIWPLKDKKLCTPGTTWKEDCNTCFCSETGHVGCTLMACLSDQIRPKRDQEKERAPRVPLGKKTATPASVQKLVIWDVL